jgi:hypothetical protein
MLYPEGDRAQGVDRGPADGLASGCGLAGRTRARWRYVPRRVRIRHRDHGDGRSAGHRICVEITSLDLPTGVAGATNRGIRPHHIRSSKTVVHKIHHDASGLRTCCRR